MTAKKKSTKVSPDKKLATVGYVKCIARHIYDHQHRQDMSCGWQLVFSAVAWIIIGVAIFLSLVKSPSANQIPEWAFWVLVAFALSTLLGVLDSYDSDTNTTYATRTNTAVNDMIAEYKEPINYDCMNPPGDDE